MRRITLVAMVFAVLVSAGCAERAPVAYDCELAPESTRTIGVAGVSFDKVAFKRAEKKATYIASAASASSSGSGSSSASLFARAVASAPLAFESSTRLELTVRKNGKPASGAKATVICTYSSGAGKQSITYKMTSGADGTATTQIVGSPYGAPTKVTISGYVIVDGQRVTLMGIGYRTNGS